ncbi:MAG: insulinase family protein [Barnesiella sp.]|nr:insulinase family protein [Barnesiella sp.]
MNISKKLTALVLLVMMIIPAIKAQMMPQLPVDPDVKIGTLPNGLTYYIRHNEYPKGQADFYIAQNVGSILEEDNQRGLAHFLEHMCFNGTTHFPGSSLRDWLETVGVKFGVNLNAYTGVDETVYNISNVPVARTSVQDSCLLILHDWANDLLLLDEEIDKERGVIHEEWRRSNVGQMRILERILPDMYPGTKYGHRLPIGTMEVVDNFPYQALRDYYEKWYRPDQQAVIVVGDIDVDYIEGKIKEMFADIEMPANPAERIYEAVPDHEGTIYLSGADPEQQVLIGEIMFISDPMPKEMKNTAGFYAMHYMERMISMMLNQRLDDIASTPDAPYANAGCSFGNFLIAKTKDAFTVSVIAKGNEIDPALEAVYRETLRAARNGFTQTEYDRARDEFMSQIERQFNNRATRENDVFVREYVDNFTDGDPILAIENEYDLFKQLAYNIPVEAINMAMNELITKDNRVVLALAPEKEGIVFPTKEAMEAVINAVDAESIEAFVDNVKTEPLIPALPAPGSVVATATDARYGTTVWTLSNGAKVIIKPTKFKEDEILFTAVAHDGLQRLGNEYDDVILLFNEDGNANGLGDYTNADLKKYTQGKQASVSISLDNYERQLGGFTTPKDLPTLMELIYMSFNGYNFTADEYAALQNAEISALKHQESNPQVVFLSSVYDNLYGNHRQGMLKATDVEKADRQMMIDMVKAMTANAADYTFIFVGNVDLETLRPLVEQYIATLPADAATAVTELNITNPAYQIKGGNEVKTTTTPMSTPQTWVAIIESGNMPFNTKNALVASIAGQVLGNRLLKTVREEMGAVYSIGAQGGLDYKGNNNAVLQTLFPMKPEMKQEVLDYIAGEFKAMENNVTPDEIAPAKEYMAKSYAESLEKNGPWLSAIASYLLNGVDSFNERAAVLETITVNDVMDYMRQLNAQNNYQVIILDPAE